MTDFIPSFSFINFLAKKYNFSAAEEYILFKIEYKEPDVIAKKEFSVLAAEMADTLRINIDDLFVRCKKKEIVYPRHLLRHIAYENNVGSLQQIARLTNCRGHDTVIHSIKTSKILIEIKDRDYMRYYQPLAHLLDGK
jgi:chromosomal replication initiation ATPase DnaA